MIKRLLTGAATAAVALAVASPAGAAYKLPPTNASWYWEINPPKPGLAGLPATSARYPAPGSANIWDTDLFQDSNARNAGIPTGPSPVVQAIHAAGHYSICYVEAGAYQTGLPDQTNFAPADYGNGAAQYQMAGYTNEWWLNLAGFANYQAGDNSTLTGAAVDIAGALAQRLSWCALEGQDAVEADDLDGYTNDSNTGAPGGGWGLTQADAAGFERWLSYTIHADGMAWFLKNDTANANVDEPLADGVVTEECNAYEDPCAGGGDWDAFLSAGKPVLNAEYVQDGETTSSFCPADNQYHIWGALFNTALNGRTYQPCWTS